MNQGYFRNQDEQALDEDIVSKILMKAQAKNQDSPMVLGEIQSPGLEGLETAFIKDDAGMIRNVPKELGEGSAESAIMAAKMAKFKDPRTGQELEKYSSIMDAALDPIKASKMSQDQQSRIESVAAMDAKDVTKVDVDPEDPRELRDDDGREIITGDVPGEITVEGPVPAEAKALLFKMMGL